MTKRGIWLSSAAMVAAAGLAQQAQAQSLTLADAPARSATDEHGVDMASGAISTPSSSVGIGGDRGLAHTRFRVDNGWRHNYLLAVTREPAGAANGDDIIRVQIGGGSVEFQETAGGLVALNGSLATLTEGPHAYTFTATDGTQYRFNKNIATNGGTGKSYYGPVEAVGQTITRSSGHVTTLHYRSDDYNAPDGTTIFTIRLQSVTTNTGYQLKYSYVDNTPQPADEGDGWFRISRVTAINAAQEYCDPVADSCSLANAWPYLAYASNPGSGETIETATDALNRQAAFRSDSTGRLLGVKRPGETSEGFQVSYDANGRVKTIVEQGSYQRDYTYGAPGNNELQAVSDDALGRKRVVVSDLTSGIVKRQFDALGNYTYYTYDGSGRLAEVTAPEGNKVVYARDAAGRVTSVTRKARPGSTEADIVTSATYPALDAGGGTTCSDLTNCFKPLTSTDARGKTTLYDYDAVHGGLTRRRSPIDSNGNRARTTIVWRQRNARIKNASGTLVTSGDAIWLPEVVRICRIATGCSGTADEHIVTSDHDTQVSPNLHTTSQTDKNGTATSSATTSYTYTALGLPETVDGPYAGTADTTTMRYDVIGQLVGTILPDPDGGGVHMASRVTYNADGQVVTSQTGTVAGTSEAAWNAFAPDLETRTDYDAFGRVAAERQVRPGTTTQYSLVEYGYDYAGRPECTALRMNAPTIGTSTASDACTVTSGSDDRIARTYYDLADRATQSWSALGTSLQQRTVLTEYDGNGVATAVEDAKGNRTTYTIDGHGRTERVTYPDASFESVTFDAGSNVLTHTTRRGETLSYQYDNLGRVIRKTVPGRTGLDPMHTRDVFYAYDLFGNLTQAKFDSLAGPGITNLYDGRGRLTYTLDSTTGTARANTYIYDDVGNLTQIRYPDHATSDPRTVNYSYDILGRLTHVRDAQSNLLLQKGYDNEGYLTQDYRGPAAYRSNYGYDDAGRLSSHANTKYGGAKDGTQTFVYTMAQELKSETQNNTDYVYDITADATVGYQANALNQYTQVGSTAYTYDANGNLTFDGATTFTYDVENRLVKADGGAGAKKAETLYDPLGRLAQVTNNYIGDITRFHYAGNAMIAEYDGAGDMIRRHVHGVAAGDDPIALYYGSDMGISNAYLLNTDRLGSIVLRAQRDGTNVQAYAYDEYGNGQPAAGTSGNIGRFRYTGQAYLGELGLYYYKARMYSPSIGRFLQSDPIGYGDGMNMYAYVGNNATNATDPTGMACVTRTSNTWCPNFNRQDSGSQDGRGGSGGDGGGGRKRRGGPTSAKLSTPPALIETGLIHVFGGLSLPGYLPGSARLSLFGIGNAFAMQASVSGNSQPQNEIVVTGTPHKYVIGPLLSPCPAGAVFDYFKGAGHSAPGAPAAREGLTPRIVLYGNNPISQSVNSSTGTIVNTTLPGHVFHPGTVTIQVSPVTYRGVTSNQTSTITITGEGTGAFPEANEFFGEAWFAGQAAGALNACGR